MNAVYWKQAHEATMATARAGDLAHAESMSLAGVPKSEQMFGFMGELMVIQEASAAQEEAQAKDVSANARTTSLAVMAFVLLASVVGGVVITRSLTRPPGGNGRGAGRRREGRSE